MEKTLVILKPSAIQRELVGEIIKRFERKGLALCGLKMIQLTEAILNDHYAELRQRPYFNRIRDAMMSAPVIVSCREGLDAVKVVREMTGATNGRDSLPGTIRGDFSMSIQENIIHTSDSIENAKIELNRFFKAAEIFEYKKCSSDFLYAKEQTP